MGAGIEGNGLEVFAAEAAVSAGTGADDTCFAGATAALAESGVEAADDAAADTGLEVAAVAGAAPMAVGAFVLAPVTGGAASFGKATVLVLADTGEGAVVVAGAGATVWMRAELVSADRVDAGTGAAPAGFSGLSVAVGAKGFAIAPAGESTVAAGVAGASPGGGAGLAR